MVKSNIVILETEMGKIDAPVVISETMPDKLASLPNGFGMEFSNPVNQLFCPVLQGY